VQRQLVRVSRVHVCSHLKCTREGVFWGAHLKGEVESGPSDSDATELE